MVRKRPLLGPLLLALSLALGAGHAPPAASAEPRDLLERIVKKKARERGGAAEAGRGALSLDEAVKIVRRRHPKAEVVGAQTREDAAGGRRVHEVRILRKNGQVKTYRFDAATGASLD